MKTWPDTGTIFQQDIGVQKMAGVPMWISGSSTGLTTWCAGHNLYVNDSNDITHNDQNRVMQPRDVSNFIKDGVSEAVHFKLSINHTPKDGGVKGAVFFVTKTRLDLYTPGIDEAKEEDPGKFVRLPEKPKDPPKLEEVALLHICMPRQVKTGTVTLEKSGDTINVWGKGGTEVVLGDTASTKSWDLSDDDQRANFHALQHSLWVQGLKEGESKVTVKHSSNSGAKDTIKFTVFKFDLDINTDDHPKLAGTQIPTVSGEKDITDSDEEKEEKLGGYLWVNDDNDNNTGAADATIDLNDSANYVDDDLERVKCEISDSVWKAKLKVRVESIFPAGTIKVWKKNKSDELSVNTEYSTKTDIDSDSDKFLWLEGLKRGSGVLTIKLMDGKDVLAEDKIKATVYRVGKVAWESDGDTVVGNDIAPVGVGQKRLFPGKTTPTDANTRDKPRVTVTITPAIPAESGWHLPVACVVRDVDHYANAAIVGRKFDAKASSNDEEGHDDGFCPNDNRTGYTGKDDPAGAFGASGDTNNIGIEVSEVADDTVESSHSSATECYWSESIGVTRKGKALLHITHHTPCNNWRVFAGCAGAEACPWPKARSVRINNLATDGVTLEYIDDTALSLGTSDGTASRSTQTLTVWRKLHLEQDHMAPPVNFVEPAAINERSIQEGRITGGTGTVTIATSCNAKLANQWSGGIVQFYRYTLAAKTFVAAGEIQSNTVGPNSSITLTANSPSNVTHVFITDDDVSAFNGTDASGAAASKKTPGMPDTTLFNNADMFHAAAIHMETDTGKDSADATFDLNIDDAEKYVSMEEKKGIRGGIGYWVATAMISYQGPSSASGDGNDAAGSSSFRRGVSMPYWTAGPITDGAEGGFQVYVETIRDWVNIAADPNDSFETRLRRTTLHECGHVLGGQHTDSGLMAGSIGTNPTNGAFSGMSLRRFMLLRDEGPGHP